MICSIINRCNYRFEICKNGDNIFIKHPEIVKLKSKKELKQYVKDVTSILELCKE